MSEIEDRGLERRLERNTYILIALALAGAIAFSGLRMALGVLLGGALSLFNKRWLESSIRVLLDKSVATQSGRIPSFTASKLILRYFVIVIAIGIAVWTREFHPLGIGVGFAAFVGGAMVEAGYQLLLSFKPGKDGSEK